MKVLFQSELPASLRDGPSPLNFSLAENLPAPDLGLCGDYKRYSPQTGLVTGLRGL